MFNYYGFYDSPQFKVTLGCAKYAPKRSQEIKNKR